MSDWFTRIFRPRLHRRRQWATKPIPKEWQTIIAENVPFAERLPATLQRQLEQRVVVFLREKSFEACGDLGEITDEIRVTIAAQACMLTLGREEYYDRLRSILIYPSSYFASEDGQGHRFGESWTHGSVVLAWDNVQHGAFDMRDGHNLVWHEFAHQLDQADGVGDGAPILNPRSRYVTWARAFGEAYAKLLKRLERNHRTVIDEYGATNPAEFFAVATETFLEKPKQLKKRYPDLYQELAEYYCLDPVEW